MTDAHNTPFIFINRKGRFSVNILLISDSNCKILAANALYPGSVHDSAIWCMSTIRDHLWNRYESGKREVNSKK